MNIKYLNTTLLIMMIIVCLIFTQIINKIPLYRHENMSSTMINSNDSINNELSNMINNEKTDKNTLHSYLNLYYHLFKDRKESAKNILEVGIAGGGSIKLWGDYFTNATVYGIDIMDGTQIWEDIKNKDNIILYTSTNAYDENFVKTEFSQKNIKFDILLDDGPHTLESMKLFIKLYSQIMNENSILIIEDVQDLEWINILVKETPDELKKYITVYDLRRNKQRYDDIVFTINKIKLDIPENHYIFTGE